MRNSIRKIASLCLAMAMILSTMAMPALAEERAVHIHNYTISSTKTSCSPVDDEQHVTTTTYTYICDCRDTYQDYSEVYGYHAPSGGPISSHTSVDVNGNVIVVYLYRCRACGATYSTQ